MKEVQEFIRKQNMIEAGDCVLAGVSGGADSVCLLMELLEFQETCPFVLKVVHIEHGSGGMQVLPMQSLWKNSAKSMRYRFSFFLLT